MILAKKRYYANDRNCLIVVMILAINSRQIDLENIVDTYVPIVDARENWHDTDLRNFNDGIVSMSL